MVGICPLKFVYTLSRILPRSIIIAKEFVMRRKFDQPLWSTWPTLVILGIPLLANLAVYFITLQIQAWLQ